MKLVQRIVLAYYRNKFNKLGIVAPRLAAAMAFKLFSTPYTKNRKYQVPPIFETAEKLQLSFYADTVNGFRWKPGQNSNGQKILLCHGFDGFSYRFDKYVTALLNEEFEVLAFDAPAHGTSKGKTISAIQYRDMIVAISNFYGPVDGIMAHSFGGLATALALEQMDNHTCKRLVLVAPATESSHAIESFFHYVQLSTRVRQAFNKLIEELVGNPASWFSVARIMQRINVPTLWIHDKEDRITPYAHMHHLTEIDLPHIEFEITNGLGHSPDMDETIQTRVVSFFTGRKGCEGEQELELSHSS